MAWLLRYGSKRNTMANLNHGTMQAISARDVVLGFLEYGRISWFKVVFDPRPLL
jgi:hypothetical protein